jgi:hypothetical protein
VNCDTVQALTTRQPVDGAKLCPAAHDTADTDFITGKGLTVTDFGTVYDGTKPTGGAAFVLISHGVTGMGAYSASGIRKDLPNAADEKNNTKDTGPFTLEAASNPDIGVNNNNHYDDFLLYRTVADLAKRAHLAARDWPDDVLAGVAFDQSTVQSYLGGNPSSNGGDTGVTSITFPGVAVSAFDSGGAQDLGYSSGSSPGLGGVSGGSNDLTSTGGEGLRFDFTQGANQFSASLGGWNSPEVAQIQFWTVDPTTNVATWIATKSQIGCGSSNVGSFSIDVASLATDPSASFNPAFATTPNVPFNRVEIRPESGASFHVSEIRTCIAGVTCQTTLYPTGDQC